MMSRPMYLRRVVLPSIVSTTQVVGCPACDEVVHTMPHRALTFLVTTQNPSQEGAPSIQDINAHIATHSHARRTQKLINKSLNASTCVQALSGPSDTSASETRIAQARDTSLVLTRRSRPQLHDGFEDNTTRSGEYTEDAKGYPIFSYLGLNPFLKLPLNFSVEARELIHFRKWCSGPWSKLMHRRPHRGPHPRT